MQCYDHVLVTGSTDSTVRIWDLQTLRQAYNFTGHASTVRALEIVEPTLNRSNGNLEPPYPLIVTGSRDATLRVWRLPGIDTLPVRFALMRIARDWLMV
jgi:F-box and WD-40 domain protein CDC4